MGFDAGEGVLDDSVACFEGRVLAGDEGVEVVGRDELVLGPVDEADEVRQPVVGVAPARVVDERQGRADVAQKEDLADAVEDVEVAREAGLAGVVGQDAVAEAVEVADGQPRAGGRADRLLDPFRELAGGPDVVGQDEDLLGDERIGEGVVVRGRFRRKVAGLGAVRP